MAPRINQKCLRCSRLTREEAIAQHGEAGDGCWAGQNCDNRRSHYRHRLERNQARKSPVDDDGTVVLELPAIALPAAFLYWYRERKDAPLHAIGAELWSGNDRIARIEPVHCLGLTEAQVKTLLVRILDGFSQQCGKKVERFRASHELLPEACPIRPCPLHPGES